MSQEHHEIAQPGLQFAFNLHVTISDPIVAGKTPAGTAIHIPITGGTFEGPQLCGEVLPGADRLTIRADGVRFVSALYEIRTDDGVLITVRNEGPALEGRPTRTAPRFSAPEGEYDWLNKSIFVGTVEASVDQGFVSIRIDQVT